MELKIDFKSKKIRIVGNVESKDFQLLDEILRKLFSEDEAFMIVNEAETSPLRDFPQQRPKPTTNPLDLINNPHPWVNPLEKSSGLRRQDPVVPWKMTYDNNDSITETLLKVTCTACTGDCTHNILNPNPNSNV